MLGAFLSFKGPGGEVKRVAVLTNNEVSRCGKVFANVSSVCALKLKIKMQAGEAAVLQSRDESC